MDMKTQYHKYTSSQKTINPEQILLGTWEADSNMYVEKQSANYSQDSAEEKGEGRLHHQNPGLLKGLINTFGACE